MNKVSKNNGILKALLEDICAALMLLSCIPVPWDRISKTPPNLHRAMWAYPVVGIVIGGISAGVFSVASLVGLPPSISILLAMSMSILLTGAFHEDGLADVADGFGGGVTREKKLEIMRDSRIGTYGGLALIFAFGFKFLSLNSIVLPGVFNAFVIAAVVSRSMIIVTARILPPARKNSLATEAGKPSFITLFIAFGFAVIVSVLLSSVFSALVILSAAILVTLLFCAVAYWQVQGFSGDVLGATQQVSEIAILVALSAVWGA